MEVSQRRETSENRRRKGRNAVGMKKHGNRVGVTRRMTQRESFKRR